jgi:hypothetical protein
MKEGLFMLQTLSIGTLIIVTAILQLNSIETTASHPAKKRNCLNCYRNERSGR